ncbi:MAG: radical SAM protein [Candidatus Lindowbacteria bacterium]|nr:radical SAM protein [Candidatus Lindowbacteria bacterium]
MFSSSGLRDIFNLLLRSFLRGHLTIRKVFNMASACVHMMLKSERSSFLPPGIVIDVANFCNLRCPGCGFTINFDKITAQSYPVDQFEKVVNEVKDHTVVMLLYLSGEPLLHREFTKIVKTASEAGISTITSTNASWKMKEGWAEQLIEAGLDTVIFSVSGMTQEVYERYHVRGRLDELLKNIRTLSAARKKLGRTNPIIHMRYLATEYNDHEIEDFRKFSDEIDCDIFEIRRAYNLVEEETEGDIPPSGLYDPREEADHYGPKKMSNVCHWTYLMPVVKVDSSIVPCCYDYFQLPPLGNTGTDGFAEMWNGSAYRNFRKFMASRRHDIPACDQCTTRIGFQTQFGDENITIKIPTAAAPKE